MRHFLPWIPGDDLPDYAAGVPITGELRAGRDAGTLPSGAGWFARASRPAEELFDAAADPDEIADLAADPTHDADRARLRIALEHWMRQTRDTGILPEPILRREAAAAGSEWAIFHPSDDDAGAARRGPRPVTRLIRRAAAPGAGPPSPPPVSPRPTPPPRPMLR